MDYKLMFLFLRKLNGVGVVKQNKTYAPFMNENKDEKDLFEFILSKEKKLTQADLDVAYEQAKKEYDAFITDSSVQVLSVFDVNYPQKLNDLGDKRPVLLFVKGDLNALSRESLGVIGTREPSDRSVAAESKMVEQAVKWTGRAIVSGMALGCDFVAHRTALDNDGCTIAVLPSGFNHIYPMSHIDLAKEIAESSGCLLSEYTPEEMADKYTFVRRDTLVAALSDKLFVVECGLNSGTMYAVTDAVKMERPIGCFHPNDITFEGNAYIMTEYNADSITVYSDWDRFLG